MSRIELAKIPALTFYKDSLTEARRTRCESLGGSGTEVDWKCQADLPDSLRFGRVEVSCEGWARPGDAYVLKGSCALEYRLVQVPGTLRNSDSDNAYGVKEDGWLTTTVFMVIWFAVLAIIVYSFVKSCMNGGTGNRVGGGPRPGPRPGYGGFFPGGFNDNDAAPPPPYSKTNPDATPNQNQGWRPGFWTGAAIGGLGAHLFNNRQNNRAYDWERERMHPNANRFQFQSRRSGPRYSSDDRGEGSSNLGAMRQSTGFGGSNGQGWGGDTVCASGSVCTVLNPYYSQCLAGSGSGTTTTSGPTTTSSAPSSGGTSCSNRTKFKYFGVNQSGAEFGQNTIPGTWGKDFTFPAPSSIDYFVGKGFNFFRVPFLMERMVSPSTGITGPLVSSYLANYTSIINYITNTKGAYAAIDPHNFMSFNGAQITNTASFQTFWTNLAGQFKSNSRVIFDVMNEPNGIAASTVFALNQAAVNGIRAISTLTFTQELLGLVHGVSDTILFIRCSDLRTFSAWQSSGNADAFAAGIKDPNNNWAIQMHQYLDSDGSGTNAVCVNSTIGASRIADATNWLKSHNFKGFLGEIGAGSDSTCITAVQGAMCAMQQSGAWIGASWWAAGPWWGNYFTSIEPPSGLSIAQILPQALMPFL
ncbi:putative endoglucanase [Mycena indigotica]|uniref:cellulase n=1 Tax=Mycena indigotica TaxID=2126181 RepID=A0A8H6T0J0_9AGAR|nr:putative endoglucanase [Mycena indigotica]KAF7309725.1 putative endoglucanase [Mycena indigotica]